jgi:hypothetical protein
MLVGLGPDKLGMPIVRLMWLWEPLRVTALVHAVHTLDVSFYQAVARVTRRAVPRSYLSRFLQNNSAPISCGVCNAASTTWRPFAQLCWSTNISAWAVGSPIRSLVGFPGCRGVPWLPLLPPFLSYPC